MAGNKVGGKKAAQTNKKRYGSDFYQRIGAKGGNKTRDNGLNGFANPKPGKDGLTGPERARIVGSKGGRISKRRKMYA